MFIILECQSFLMRSSFWSYVFDGLNEQAEFNMFINAIYFSRVYNCLGLIFLQDTMHFLSVQVCGFVKA
jgi:hypothetical protein